MAKQGLATAGFDEYRGIYLKRIPTYSFPLMLDVAAQHGADPDKILEHCEFTHEDLQREETLVSFLQAAKFIRHVLAHTPRPDIGLLTGNSYTIATYGVLGYAMMSCPTWLEALRLANSYYKAASSLVHIQITESENMDRVRVQALPFYPDLVDIEPFTVEKLFTSLIATTRPLLAKTAYPISAKFSYPAPDYADEYMAYFKCPLEFDAGGNYFEWDLETLQQPVLAANAVSAEIARKLCQQFVSQHHQPDGIAHKVSEMLLQQPGRLLSMEEMAERLHVSSRTLRRKLRSEDTTFQAICDDVRHNISRAYLQNSRLSVEEIADLVGFSETTNFRRAFKRWEGQAPATYRRQMA